MAQILIEAREWGAEAESLIGGHESARDLDSIRAQVQAGAAVLFHVEQSGGEMVAAVVLRVDDLEGVIVSAAGVPGFDLTRDVLPAMERRFEGVESIRIHTGRPGLCRKLTRQGYEAAEIVMRKRVK